jgi:hypothetical protein
MSDSIKQNKLKKQNVLNTPVKTESRHELKQLLLDLTEQGIFNRFSDRKLDRENQKIKLRSGKIIDLYELDKYIDDKINTYAKEFGQDYYLEIFRLNGWKIPESGIISYKPNIVGRYTIDIIYGRFPKEVLPTIEGNNKYNEIGIRLYKHFQFLTPKGIELLEKFIEDSVIVMKKCKFWDEFVEEHARIYGFPFQTSLFN